MQDQSIMTTGYPSIDAIISGFEKSELTIIASRQSEGKTTCMLNMLNNLCLKENNKALVFSLELPAHRLIGRLMRSVHGKEWKIEELGSVISDFTSVSSGSNIYIDDSPTLSIAELEEKVREVIRKRQIDIIFIDYIDLLNNHEHSKTIDSLKLLAKETNLPIVGTASAHQSTIYTAGLAPQLSEIWCFKENLRNASMADVICTLHRPDLHSAYLEESMRRSVLFSVLKNNHGNIANTWLLFDAENMRITEREN